MLEVLNLVGIHTQDPNLPGSNEAFYFMDYGQYRVFNYRLASYTDFLAKDALEARGIMFYMHGDNLDIPHLVPSVQEVLQQG
jgi:hypothetical protein